MLEVLPIGVVKESWDALGRLCEAWRICKWGGRGGERTKASLINEGSLQVEGFLTSCSFICCSVKQAQVFLLVISLC